MKLTTEQLDALLSEIEKGIGPGFLVCVQAKPHEERERIGELVDLEFGYGYQVGRRKTSHVTAVNQDAPGQRGLAL